jgi:hypothetical protein
VKYSALNAVVCCTSLGVGLPPDGKTAAQISWRNAACRFDHLGTPKAPGESQPATGKNADERTIWLLRREKLSAKRTKRSASGRDPFLGRSTPALHHHTLVQRHIQPARAPAPLGDNLTVNDSCCRKRQTIITIRLMMW